MKSGSVIRVIDELGRVVIPVDMRRRLEYSAREQVEIYIDGSKIIIEKAEQKPAKADPQKPSAKADYSRLRVVRKSQN